MSRWGIPPALLAAGAGICLLAPGAARADFSETACAGGSPAAPWTIPSVAGSGAFAGEVDLGGSGERLGFTIEGLTIGSGASDTAGIVMPPGEALTGVSVTYTTLPASDSDAVVFIDSDGAELSGTVTGQSDVTYTGALADASSIRAPHRRVERIVIRIRDGRRPTGRVLR